MASLIQKTDGRQVMHYSTKETAVCIRRALKAAFSGVTFSVRIHEYSMGSSVYISWTDGPTSPEVRLVTDRFSSQSFDGMTDSTSYHTQEVDGLLVQYQGSISTNRNMTDGLIALAKRRAEILGIDNVWSVMNTMRPNGCIVRLKEAVA